MIGSLPDGSGCPVRVSDESAYKRVVLQDKDGLRVILGRSEGQPADYIEVSRAGQPVGFSLVKAKRGYYLYKEIVSPRTGKLGEFDPRQV